MLNFLPVLLVLIALLALLVLRRSRMPIGTIWLILTGLSLLNWGAVLLLRFRIPQPFVMDHWFPGGLATDPLIFALSEKSWLLLFTMATLLVGILFSSSGHLHEPHITNDLVEVLGLAAVGTLAMLAESPLAFLLIWGVIDIVEVTAFTLLNREENLQLQTFAIFIGRALGLVLVIGAMALSGQNQTPLDLGTAEGKVFTLLIVGAGLRLGVLPFHLPYTQDIARRRNLGTILRILAPLSALAFLSQLASPAALNGWEILILVFAILCSILGAVNWFTASNELVGRPYWLLTFTGFAFVSYFHGQSQSVIVWTALMVMVGGWIFLSEYHTGKLDFLMLVAVLDLTALPYTPAAAGLVGISVGPYAILNVVLWISLALVLAGLIRFSLQSKETALLTENWMKLFYSVGMGLLVLVPWTILAFHIEGWNHVEYWWVALFSLLIVAAIHLVNYLPKTRNWYQSLSIVKTVRTFEPVGMAFNRFFHFDWLYQIISFLFKVQQMIVNGLNGIIEGEGGILWALVFLALLISLLVSGGLSLG